MIGNRSASATVVSDNRGRERGNERGHHFWRVERGNSRERRERACGQTWHLGHVKSELGNRINIDYHERGGIGEMNHEK